METLGLRSVLAGLVADDDAVHRQLGDLRGDIADLAARIGEPEHPRLRRRRAQTTLLVGVLLLTFVALGVLVAEGANNDLDYADEQRAESRNHMQQASIELVYGAVQSPNPADLVVLTDAVIDAMEASDADTLDRSVKILDSYLDPVVYESVTQEIAIAHDLSIEALRKAADAENGATQRRLLGTLLATVAATALGAVLGGGAPSRRHR